MSAAEPIRVLVVHEDPVTEAGLKWVLGRFPDIEIVDGVDTQTLFASEFPPVLRVAVDVVVADYDTGVRYASSSGEQNPRSAVRVAVLTLSNQERDIQLALRCGVRGYLLMGCSPDELAVAVREIHAGTVHLSPQIAHRLAESLYGQALTSREVEVLSRVVDGLCNKEIARHLDVELSTIKAHLRAIFRKLNVDSRTQAIGAAERRGLLQREQAAQIEAQGSQHQSRRALIHHGAVLAHRSSQPQWQAPGR